MILKKSKLVYFPFSKHGKYIANMPNYIYHLTRGRKLPLPRMHFLVSPPAAIGEVASRRTSGWSSAAKRPFSEVESRKVCEAATSILSESLRLRHLPSAVLSRGRGEHCYVSFFGGHAATRSQHSCSVLPAYVPFFTKNLLILSSCTM